MTLIDSHCHLDFPDFAAELDAIVERAHAAGVERLVTISTRVRRGDGLVAVAERFPNVYFTIGTHPHEAAEEPEVDAAAIRDFAAHPKCVGIGEAGLDYHYNYAPPDIAARVFRAQIGLARELKLPLVIHAREADDDVARILRAEMAEGAFTAVLHCFTSSRALAETGLELGLYISFSGVLTFKNSADLRAIARDVPLDRVLVETDAPFLAPTPHRGKRNEPSFVVETARALAAVKGVDNEAIAAATRANTLRLFAENERRGQGLSRALTILGCGSSGGVPRVAQGWGACDPNNPRNNRRRCSALLERQGPEGKTVALIDTSPDLRWQLIDAGVDRLDGVLLTHPHADHTHGIDDLRPLVIAMRKRIEIHMDAQTSAEVTGKFSYVFASPPGSSYPPILRETRLTAGETCAILGPGGEIDTMPFDLHHGDITALGIRFGGLAYTPDLIDIPDVSLPYLEGLDVWIIDALRYSPHPSHLSVDQALAWIERMRPRRAILTNLHTDLDYEALRARLPDNVVPAYDGMRVEGF